MTDLVDLADEIQRLLESKRWEFCFIGGVAVQHWGEPRLTRDIDVSLLTRFQNEREYVEELLSRYQPRVDDAAEFAMTHRVLLLEDDTGIGIDVSLAGMPFEESAVRRAVPIEVLGGRRLRLCSAEDLIVYKAFADRPRDWNDVRTIVARQGTHSLDWEYVFRFLTPLADLKETPEICRELEQIRLSGG